MPYQSKVRCKITEWRKQQVKVKYLHNLIASCSIYKKIHPLELKYECVYNYIFLIPYKIT